MSIKSSADVRQDIIDALNGDGPFPIDAHWFAGCVLTWMNEDMCREMVDNMADFEDMTEQYGWEDDEDEEE